MEDGMTLPKMVESTHSAAVEVVVAVVVVVVVDDDDDDDKADGSNSCKAARVASTPNCVAVTFRKDPPKVPKGVRFAATINIPEAMGE